MIQQFHIWIFIKNGDRELKDILALPGSLQSQETRRDDNLNIHQQWWIGNMSQVRAMEYYSDFKKGKSVTNSNMV